ncbi:MAG: hypothetical protein HY331_04425 [Chloroflexi bacterium]|nr:hypothetical protein [Chloroflexota bacterium]
MPDGDVIPRRPVPLWKRPYALMHEEADTETIAAGVAGSLWKSLSSKGGLPGASEFADVVGRVASQEITLMDALEQLREIEWQNSGHLHTRLAARAVATLLVGISQGDPLMGPPLRVVIEHFCWEMVRFQLVGRIGPDRQGNWFSTYDERLAWEQKLKEALWPKIAPLVTSLEHDPTGRRSMGVRVPAPSGPTTASVLDMDLLCGASSG